MGEQDTIPAVMWRRIGDIIQTVVAAAILGLFVVIMDLKTTIVKNQAAIEAQNTVVKMQIDSLRESVRNANDRSAKVEQVIELKSEMRDLVSRVAEIEKKLKMRPGKNDF